VIGLEGCLHFRRMPPYASDPGRRPAAALRAGWVRFVQQQQPAPAGKQHNHRRAAGNDPGPLLSGSPRSKPPSTERRTTPSRARRTALLEGGTPCRCARCCTATALKERRFWPCCIWLFGCFAQPSLPRRILVARRGVRVRSGCNRRGSVLLRSPLLSARLLYAATGVLSAATSRLQSGAGRRRSELLCGRLCLPDRSSSRHRCKLLLPGQ
jgi:hypothetical protein